MLAKVRKSVGECADANMSLLLIHLTPPPSSQAAVPADADMSLLLIYVTPPPSSQAAVPADASCEDIDDQEMDNIRSLGFLSW